MLGGQYDPATGLHTRTYTDNNDTSYAYDSLGRLWHVTAVKLNGSTLTIPQITTYTYDGVGDLDTVANDDGTTTTADDLTHKYTYDAMNRLDTLTVKVGSVNLFKQDFNFETTSHAFEYEADGQRGGVVETRYDAAGTVISTNYIDYEYDALNRLTKETRDSDNDSVRSGDDYVADYDFDLAGNRHSKILDAADNSKDETITYVYDDRDRLESEDSNNISAHDFAYVYNDNGSMTDKGSNTYVWDLRNRMTSATVGGTTTAYGYDESGQRVSQKTGSGDTTYFVNDRRNPSGSPQVLEEKAGASLAAATLSRSYVLGSEPSGQADANGTLRFVRDGHGSDRGLVNSTGKLVERYDFDAFGLDVSLAHINPSTNAATPTDSADAWTIQLFGGDAEYDPASRFYYHDARWRDGGSFVSYDSFEANPAIPEALHKYVYASSNSIFAVDPSGHESLAQTLGATTVMTINFSARVAPVAAASGFAWSTISEIASLIGIHAAVAAVGYYQITHDGGFAGDPETAMYLASQGQGLGHLTSIDVDRLAKAKGIHHVLFHYTSAARAMSIQLEAKITATAKKTLSGLCLALRSLCYRHWAVGYPVHTE